MVTDEFSIFVHLLVTHPPIFLLHGSYAHWGSWTLTDRVKLLKPKVHVFGHVHNSHGIVRRDDTLYINAAQDMTPQPIFFDIWV